MAAKIIFGTGRAAMWATAGALALMSLSSPALSSMPVLTPSPSPATAATCTHWALQQDEDALYMWGTTESGDFSKVDAIRTLVGFCLGREAPDIVGWGSSAGFDDAYCEKHANAQICVTRKSLEKP